MEKQISKKMVVVMMFFMVLLTIFPIGNLVQAEEMNCMNDIEINIDTGVWVKQIDIETGKWIKVNDVTGEKILLTKEELQEMDCQSKEREEKVESSFAWFGIYMLLMLVQVVMAMIMLVVGIVLSVHDHKNNKTKLIVWIFTHIVCLILMGLNTISFSIYLMLNNRKKWGIICLVVNLILLGIIFFSYFYFQLLR